MRVEQAQALDALLLAPVVSEAAAPEMVRDRLRRREAALRAVLEGLPDATVAASAATAGSCSSTPAPRSCSATARDELLGQPVSMLWAERRARALHAQHGALLRHRAPAAVHARA